LVAKLYAPRRTPKRLLNPRKARKVNSARPALIRLDSVLIPMAR